MKPKRKKRKSLEIKKIYLHKDYGLVFFGEDKKKYSLKAYQDGSGAICSLGVEEIKVDL